MVPESPLERGEHGLVPATNGWFVLNAADAPWIDRPGRGFYCEFEGFEGAADFPQLGINLTVLAPGEPIGMYHYENDQEDFLVLAGEALLLVEGEERPLRRWDLAHCPAGTEHIIIGAGDGPCVVLCVGARDRSTGADWGAYTVDPVALRHGVGVEQQTADADVAYAKFPERRPTGYRPGWLPGD
ncbi:MAG: hypothetical protein QOI17_1563 [Gaiellales bacterium]|jgi:uncharacterized cupin superfamily protein|nr:hypothetical protein [Gaiellales bacterium]